MKCCIFPNDPILAYYNKGELKERYFNPKNFFDEIHIISLIDKDIEETKVQVLAGDAKLKIYSVGKINLKNRKKHVERIVELVKKINPDVIRTFNPFVEGWLAAKCSKQLNIPMYLSLHTQYDENRKLAKKNLKKYLALKYTEKTIEPEVIKQAKKITVVYKIIEPYVKRFVNESPEILHNKIDFNRFTDAKPVYVSEKPLIISVGALIPVKNHECIIETMKLVDAELLIIGDGILHDELTDKVKKWNLTDKVKIIRSVPHEKIQGYYSSASVFALAYNPRVEGIPMPVMEAMAAGLPVIIPFSETEFSEEWENSGLFCKEITPESFAEKINSILNDNKMHERLSIGSKKMAKQFDQKKIEQREFEIYMELVNHSIKL